MIHITDQSENMIIFFFFLFSMNYEYYYMLHKHFIHNICLTYGGQLKLCVLHQLSGLPSIKNPLNKSMLLCYYVVTP